MRSAHRISVQSIVMRASSNNRFDLATLCHDSCEGSCNFKRATHNMAARIAPLNALQVKRMLDLLLVTKIVEMRNIKMNRYTAM